MKLLIAVIAVSASSLAFADTYVAPHIKSDGTYVHGHYKTDANNTRLDNYSSKPNANPYTGQKGAVDPYAPPKNDDPYTTKPKKSRGW